MKKLLLITDFWLLTCCCENTYSIHRGKLHFYRGYNHILPMHLLRLPHM